MIDFLHLGQGPRPDLLEEELQRKAKMHEASGSENAEPEKDAPEAVAANDAPPGECSGGEARKTKKEYPKFEWKDRAAMIIALFQLILPWLAIVAGIFLVIVLLIAKL